MTAYMATANHKACTTFATVTVGIFCKEVVWVCAVTGPCLPFQSSFTYDSVEAPSDPAYTINSSDTVKEKKKLKKEN